MSSQIGLIGSRGRSRSQMMLANISLLVLTVSANAESLTLYRDTVIPVTINSNLSLSRSHVGDRFTADVSDIPSLPSGSRLEGQVANIHKATDDRAASMDLVFDRIDFSDGHSQNIEAIPIPINRNTVDHDRDGRLVGKPDLRRAASIVAGGALGGLIVGSITHDQKAGALLGTAVGILAAAFDRDSNGDLVAKKGQKFGALLNEDLVLNLPTLSADYTPTSRPNPPTWHRDQAGVLPSSAAQSSGPTWHRNESRVIGGVPTSNADQLQITAGTRALLFRGVNRPFMDGEIAFVPLDLTAAQFGFTVDRSGENVVYVESDDFSLKLQQDSQDYRINGRKGTLDQPPLIKDGKWYVPLDVLAALTHDAVSLNGQKVVPRSL